MRTEQGQLSKFGREQTNTYLQKKISPSALLCQSVLLLAFITKLHTCSAFYISTTNHLSRKVSFQNTKQKFTFTGIRDTKISPLFGFLSYPSHLFPLNHYHTYSTNLFSAVNDLDPSSANQSIVQSRISAQIGKRNARKKNLEEARQRNLRLKNLIHTSASGDSSFPIPELYALKVTVDKELRDELHLNGREKRGRVFIEMGSDGCTTFTGLKQEIHSFFRALKRSTYLLGAALPEVSSDGTIISPSSENMDTSGFLSTHSFWSIKSDEDVVETFGRATSNFESSSQKDLYKRPTILLHIYKDPDAPLPLPPPAYLDSMPDPTETETMTMLSFYSFPVPSIQDPEEFGETLRKVWKPFAALGRVYVAEEGVNAQMAIPTNVMSNFMACCKSIPELGEYMENGINIDPIPLTMEEFRTAGTPIDANQVSLIELHNKRSHERGETIFG